MSTLLLNQDFTTDLSGVTGDFGVPLTGWTHDAINGRAVSTAAGGMNLRMFSGYELLLAGNRAFVLEYDIVGLVPNSTYGISIYSNADALLTYLGGGLWETGFGKRFYLFGIGDGSTFTLTIEYDPAQSGGMVSYRAGASSRVEYIYGIPNNVWFAYVGGTAGITLSGFRVTWAHGGNYLYQEDYTNDFSAAGTVSIGGAYQGTGATSVASGGQLTLTSTSGTCFWQGQTPGWTGTGQQASNSTMIRLRHVSGSRLALGFYPYGPSGAIAFRVDGTVGTNSRHHYDTVSTWTQNFAIPAGSYIDYLCLVRPAAPSFTDRYIRFGSSRDGMGSWTSVWDSVSGLGAWTHLVISPNVGSFGGTVVIDDLIVARVDSSLAAEAIAFTQPQQLDVIDGPTGGVLL